MTYLFIMHTACAATGTDLCCLKGAWWNGSFSVDRHEIGHQHHQTKAVSGEYTTPLVQCRLNLYRSWFEHIMQQRRSSFSSQPFHFYLDPSDGSRNIEELARALGRPSLSIGVSPRDLCRLPVGRGVGGHAAALATLWLFFRSQIRTCWLRCFATVNAPSPLWPTCLFPLQLVGLGAPLSDLCCILACTLRDVPQTLAQEKLVIMCDLCNPLQ